MISFWGEQYVEVEGVEGVNVGKGVFRHQKYWFFSARCVR